MKFSNSIVDQKVLKAFSQIYERKNTEDVQRFNANKVQVLGEQEKVNC